MVLWTFIVKKTKFDLFLLLPYFILQTSNDEDFKPANKQRRRDAGKGSTAKLKEEEEEYKVTSSKNKVSHGRYKASYSLSSISCLRNGFTYLFCESNDLSVVSII